MFSGMIKMRIRQKKENIKCLQMQIKTLQKRVEFANCCAIMFPAR